MGAKKTAQTNAARPAARSIIGKIKTRLGINSKSTQKNSTGNKNRVNLKKKQTDNSQPETQQQIKTSSVGNINNKSNAQKVSQKTISQTNNSSSSDVSKSTTVKSSLSTVTGKSSIQQKPNEDKSKAINKMLKSLDIKISGFKDILPDEQKVVECKASISEIVKTKYRAAAVKTNTNTVATVSKVVKSKDDMGQLNATCSMKSSSSPSSSSGKSMKVEENLSSGSTSSLIKSSQDDLTKSSSMSNISVAGSETTTKSIEITPQPDKITKGKTKSNLQNKNIGKKGEANQMVIKNTVKFSETNPQILINSQQSENINVNVSTTKKTKQKSQTKSCKAVDTGSNIKNVKTSTKLSNKNESPNIISTSAEQIPTQKKGKSTKCKAKDTKNTSDTRKKGKTKVKDNFENEIVSNAQLEKAKELQLNFNLEEKVLPQGKSSSSDNKKKKVPVTKKTKQTEENALQKKTKKVNKAPPDKTQKQQENKDTKCEVSKVQVPKVKESTKSEDTKRTTDSSKIPVKKEKKITKKSQQNQNSKSNVGESGNNETPEKGKTNVKSKCNKSKSKTQGNSTNKVSQKTKTNITSLKTENICNERKEIEEMHSTNTSQELPMIVKDKEKQDEVQLEIDSCPKGSKIDLISSTIDSNALLPKKVSEGEEEEVEKSTGLSKSLEKCPKNLSVRERLQRKYVNPNTFKSFKTSKEASNKTTNSSELEQKMEVAAVEKDSPKETVETASALKPEKDIYDFKTESEDEDNIRMNLLMNETVKALLEKDFSDEDDKPLRLTKLELEDDEDDKPLSQCKEEQKKDSNPSDNQKKTNNSVKTEKKSADQNESKSNTSTPVKIKDEKKQTKSPKKPPPTSKRKEKSEYVSSSSSESSTDSEDNNLRLRKKASFGPKRMASLNALAKVQCLYENESRTAHELGLSKSAAVPKMKTIHSSSGSDEEKDLNKKELQIKEQIKREPSPECESKRELRNAPGLRGVGKHWDFNDVTDFESGHESDIPFRKDYDIKSKTKKRKIPKPKVTKSKEKPEPKVKKSPSKPQKKKVKISATKVSSESSSEEEKNEDPENGQKGSGNNKRKREKSDDFAADLKGILARKRIASLNASALVAATYDIERHLDRNLGSASDCSSFESFPEDEKLQIKNSSKNTKETTTKTESIADETGKESGKETSSRPTSSSVVIVQDTDVTITGVYVNSGAGSGQEAYCKMQYRVQSSVTEERVVCPTSIDPPKSYTPLGALSSMRPPGTAVPEAGQQPHLLQSQPQAMASQQPSANIYQSPSISEEQAQQTAHIFPGHHYHQAPAIPSMTVPHHQHHQEHQQYPPAHHHYPPHPQQQLKYQHIPHHHHPLDASHQSAQLSQGRCDSPPPPPPPLRYQSGPAYQSPIPPPPTISMSGGASSAFCAPIQQSHHDITGYYQPAGPLISPHILPSVPPPGNATLVSSKQVPSPLDSDPEQQLQQPPQSTSTAESSDSEVLITGGDLTTFRYSSQQPPPTAQSQQQLSVLSSQHQPSSAYTRSMHQMHYPPAYPPSYYTPYPGDAMCYSPPYQPYFPAKIYQSAPAYRRYPSYYQPGPPPPADLYEPPPPSSAAPPPPSGSQLVPAGPTAPQHMEHYPGPPGFYSGYSPGGGQCYSRGIQPPYMDYPAPCPCPMQSCPKNVLTGPLIGSNNNGSNTSSINSNNTTNNTMNSNGITNNNNNISSMNISNSNIGQSVNSSLSNLSQTMKTNKGPVSAQHPINNKTHNHILGQIESANVSNGGSILGKSHLHHHHLHQCKMEIMEPLPKADLGIERKDEVIIHMEGRKNSQYEEEVIPPTPPTGYTINDKLIEPDITVSPSRGSTGLPTVPDQTDKAATAPPIVVNSASQSQMTATIPESETIASTNLPPMIGRKARIGKSMAREMMYKAHTTLYQHHQHPTQMYSHHHIRHHVPSHNSNEGIKILQEPNPAVITPDLDKVKKEEIKTEEEDVVVILDDEKQDVKKIKTEPEIVEVFDDRVEPEPVRSPQRTDDFFNDTDEFKKPRLTGGVKRMKILELNKPQCKKSPPNGYKSLIKQTEPKPYLCISRKPEKKEHFRKMATKSGVKKRKLLLTEQQKKRLLIRKRKLLLMEKERKEQVDENTFQDIQEKETVEDVAITSVASSPDVTIIENEISDDRIPSTGKHEGIAKNLIMECGTAKGYSSEPDVRSTTGRKTKKTKSSEVRSKSESKKSTEEAKQNEQTTCSQSTSENQIFKKSKEKSKSKEIPQVLSDSEKSNLKKSKQKTDKTAKAKTQKSSSTTKTPTKMLDGDEETAVQVNSLVDRTINNNILETNNNNKLPEAVTIETPVDKVPNTMLTPVASEDLMPHVQPLVIHPTGKRTRSRTSRRFGGRKRRRNLHVNDDVNEVVPLPRKLNVVPRWNNGWSWEGEPFQGNVFLNSDDPLVVRTCYPSMRHIEGDIIRPRDCVLLRAGSKKNELPYVAKVAHLWENPEDGEMMMSLLWYYRPEHTEQGRQPNDCPDEVFASRHRDHNSVACIEDKCYVLTFSEYCRYRRSVRAAEEGIDEPLSIVPPLQNYRNPREVPVNTNPELVMFCQRVYEFRLKRLVKAPTS